MLDQAKYKAVSGLAKLPQDSELDVGSRLMSETVKKSREKEKKWRA